MCRFIETIKITDGGPLNLPLHQERMRSTMRYFWPDAVVPLLDDILSTLPSQDGVIKARIVYDSSGIVDISMTPYKMRNVRSLRVVNDNAIEYSYKSVDRSSLERMLAMRDGCDDVVIVKKGLLTDTSYTNIALCDGQQWWTPRKPLLQGTMRQKLIAERVIYEADIALNDINQFQQIALFNAMIDFGSLVLDIKDIILGHR